ncbi:hypothetical protein N8T08_010512 [Aspergillus melleus]|uniref:Uncharacterized protein n=1 Tax=Aspergillus melleus TaxID=138277 RepID=A0ACC3ARL5_9EURO|nr:hypothetical protein N8T08_010512 [Aspergillus melleus]
MAVDRQPTGDLGLGLSTAMMILVFISLLLRLYARYQTKAVTCALHDVLIVAAAATFYAEQAAFLQGILGDGSSGGSDLSKMTLPQMDYYFKYLFVQEHLFVFCITLIKLSILLFYRSVFSIRSFLRLTWAAVALSIIWYIVVTFLLIFQCNPIHAAWDMTLKMSTAKCMSPGRLVFGIEIGNMVVDILILLLPVYMVQQLQMKTAKKASVIGIFLLGGFVCIASVVRAYYSWEADTGSPHPTTMSLNWTTIELAAALICASLPTYGPIFAKVRQRFGLTQWKSSPSSGGSSKLTGGKPLSSSGEYDQLVDQPSSTYKPVVATKTRSVPPQGDPYEMDHIHVQRSVEVV